jgi:hypothetical protein
VGEEIFSLTSLLISRPITQDEIERIAQATFFVVFEASEGVKLAIYKPLLDHGLGWENERFGVVWVSANDL